MPATRSPKPKSSIGAAAPPVSQRHPPTWPASRSPGTPRERSCTHVSESPKKDMTASVSESENPAIPAPTPKQTRPRTNRDWWPNQLDLSVLHKHSSLSNPLGPEINYAEEFKKLDVEALRRD